MNAIEKTIVIAGMIAALLSGSFVPAQAGGWSATVSPGGAWDAKVYDEACLRREQRKVGEALKKLQPKKLIELGYFARFDATILAERESSQGGVTSKTACSGYKVSLKLNLERSVVLHEKQGVDWVHPVTLELDGRSDYSEMIGEALKNWLRTAFIKERTMRRALQGDPIPEVDA
jgi:hypothetical protein